MAVPTQPGRLEIWMADHPSAPAEHLSVDGMTEAGPNLSHWPGNRTPPRFKADLSTGICLAFARASQADKATYLGDARAVVNDHYDTDGFLSMLAVVRPEVALPREEICLAAAATGDYQSFQTVRAFAIDRIVQGLPRSPASPLAAEIAGLSPVETHQRCYRWLIEHAEQVLDGPERWAALYEDELAQVRGEIDRARCGAVSRRIHPHAQLAVLHSREPLHRMTLNTVAGAFRVLHLHDSPGGLLVRYHDRTESWFEVVSFSPPPRRDLRSLRGDLASLEGSDARPWAADPPTEPVPELYCGPPELQEYGLITRSLVPTEIPAESLEARFVDFFASPPPPEDSGPGLQGR